MSLRARTLVPLLMLPCLALAGAGPEVVHLWSGGAPGFERLRDVPEQARDYWVRNVNNPSLTVFRAPEGRSNGCAVVIAPGGGFRELVFGQEGEKPAQFLNSLGITAFALKYRLPGADQSPYTMDHARQDGFRAIRLVRSRAREFGVDPGRVGILGFSAGAALALMISFDKGDGDPSAADPVDRESGRPSFVMAVYPGGEELLPAQIAPGAPPAFLLCANDDDYGCDRVTLHVLERLREAKASAEAHFVAQGRHAFNMGDRSAYLAVRHWPDRMADWLNDRGFLKGAAGENRLSD